MKKVAVSTISIALLLLSQSPGQAHSTDSDEHKGDWSFSLGAGAMAEPEYEGSKHEQFTPAPMFDVSWKDTVSLNMEDGLSVKLKPMKDKGFVVGGGLGYWRGRKEGADKDHEDALRGLGNLSGNAVGHVFTGYMKNRWSVGLRFDRDLGGDRDGTTVSLKGGYKIYENKKFSIGTELSTTWADDNYMSKMFGVSATQARNSKMHYAAYSASSGIKSIDGEISLNYKLTNSVNLFSRIGYGRLVGDAADSPITASANQYKAGVGIMYHF